MKVISKKIKKYHDTRGFFSKIYYQKKSEIKNIRQVNLSLTKKKGTIRGLHMQLGEYKEIRIIKCISGRIFDVVVDLRPNSRSFLKYKSKILTENDKLCIVIPKGFAHGFQTLSQNTKILYLHGNDYNKKNELTVYPFDKKINIKWPLRATKISNKDMNGKKFYEL